MADEPILAFVQEYRPTRRERFWRWLGFHRRWDESLCDWRSADPKPDDWFVPGAVSTIVTCHVDWKDRLRLLISGRCEVAVYTRTSVIVERAESRSLFSVLPPKENHNAD